MGGSSFAHTIISEPHRGSLQDKSGRAAVMVWGLCSVRLVRIRGAEPRLVSVHSYAQGPQQGKGLSSKQDLRCDILISDVKRIRNVVFEPLTDLGLGDDMQSQKLFRNGARRPCGEFENTFPHYSGYFLCKIAAGAALCRGSWANGSQLGLP